MSIIVTIDWLGNVHSDPEFFVGVEFAYSNNVSNLKDLVDKVKNYTIFEWMVEAKQKYGEFS